MNKGILQITEIEEISIDRHSDLHGLYRLHDRNRN